MFSNVFVVFQYVYDVTIRVQYFLVCVKAPLNPNQPTNHPGAVFPLLNFKDYSSRM